MEAAAGWDMGTVENITPDAAARLADRAEHVVRREKDHTVAAVKGTGEVALDRRRANAAALLSRIPCGAGRRAGASYQGATVTQSRLPNIGGRADLPTPQPHALTVAMKSEIKTFKPRRHRAVVHPRNQTSNRIIKTFHSHQPEREAVREVRIPW
jgi:hypothetical protein